MDSYRAVQQLIQQKNVSIPAFFLLSVPFLPKYAGVLNILFTPRGNLTFFNWNVLSPFRAMSVFQSQFCWYRRLYILFSRYSYVNTWIRI